MGIVQEGEEIPTADEQQAAYDKQQEDLAAERELHAKMRRSDTAEYARDKKEETEEAS